MRRRTRAPAGSLPNHSTPRRALRPAARPAMYRQRQMATAASLSSFLLDTSECLTSEAHATHTLLTRALAHHHAARQVPGPHPSHLREGPALRHPAGAPADHATPVLATRGATPPPSLHFACWRHPLPPEHACPFYGALHTPSLQTSLPPFAYARLSDCGAGGQAQVPHPNGLDRRPIRIRHPEAHHHPLRQGHLHLCQQHAAADGGAHVGRVRAAPRRGERGGRSARAARSVACMRGVCGICGIMQARPSITPSAILALIARRRVVVAACLPGWVHVHDVQRREHFWGARGGAI